jgi:rhodanese-related sulfurtransferase
MTRLRGAAAGLVTAIAIAGSLAAAGAALAQMGPGRITAAELKKLYDARTVLVVDVRGAAAYRTSHVAGAISVPLDTVAQKAAELKAQAAGKAIVTYCT